MSDLEPDQPDDLLGEVDPDADPDGIGRLVQPENEVDQPDVTSEEVAFDSGDADAMSAEESAMHITDAPPMGDGDGYLKEDDA